MVHQRVIDERFSCPLSGVLLISNDPSSGAVEYSPSTRTHPEMSGQERFVVTEDASSNRISEASSSLGQLGSEITNWLAERGRAGAETEREIERQSERESNGIIGRYTGHRNTRTVLKEAAFWDDKYVLSGEGHTLIHAYFTTS